jgi:hypothetical protein
MKTTRLNQLAVAFIAAVLFAVARNGHAQNLITSWTNTFDTADSIASWNHWYDLYEPNYNSPMAWDSTMNNTAGNPTSGALLCVSPWPGMAAGQRTNNNYQGQDLMVGSFAGGGNLNFAQTIDATKYDNLAFDIRVDPASPTNSAGNICTLTVVFLINNYGTYTITNIAVPTSATNGWTRYVCRINKATAPAPPNPLAAGVGFNINCYGGPNSSLMILTNPTTMWIDNIILTRSREVLPPPIMSPAITTPEPGLNLSSSFAAGIQPEYQRTSIKLQNRFGGGWLGQSNVTYSFTITNFPSAATYPGYQAHIFVTTGPGNNSSLDYGESNVVWLNVQANADGTAFANFRYKIYEPQSNTNMFGAEYIQPPPLSSAGTLVALGAPTVLGTWSMTFNQDTNVTIRGPGGVSTNFNLRADVPVPFVDPLNFVFGAQPNNSNNVGQVVFLADASITNEGTGTALVSDNFMADNTLDTTTTWSLLAQAPNSVFLFPNDAGQKVVQWTLPDSGFGLQTTTNLADPGSWTTLSGNEVNSGSPAVLYSVSGNRFGIVPSANLGANQNFFRLFTRRFTKLQVLMPGETAAPGTATGKTGTPDTQFAGAPFTVTVNAVDANWNLATSASDAIHLTSSDGAATLPADLPLLGGTATFQVTFNTTGSATVTASDVDDPTKTPNTGASTPVN